MRKILSIGAIIAGAALWLWVSALGWDRYLKGTDSSADNAKNWGRWFGAALLLMLFLIGGLTGPIAWIAMGAVAIWLLVEVVAAAWKSNPDSATIIDQGTAPQFDRTNQPASTGLPQGGIPPPPANYGGPLR